jgi:hypothetical protein
MVLTCSLPFSLAEEAQPQCCKGAAPMNPEMCVWMFSADQLIDSWVGSNNGMGDWDCPNRGFRESGDRLWGAMR